MRIIDDIFLNTILTGTVQKKCPISSLSPISGETLHISVNLQDKNNKVLPYRLSIEELALLPTTDTRRFQISLVQNQATLSASCGLTRNGLKCDVTNSAYPTLSSIEAVMSETHDSKTQDTLVTLSVSGQIKTHFLGFFSRTESIALGKLSYRVSSTGTLLNLRGNSMSPYYPESANIQLTSNGYSGDISLSAWGDHTLKLIFSSESVLKILLSAIHYKSSVPSYDKNTEQLDIWKAETAYQQNQASQTTHIRSTHTHRVDWASRHPSEVHKKTIKTTECSLDSASQSQTCTTRDLSRSAEEINEDCATAHLPYSLGPARYEYDCSYFTQPSEH